MRKRTTEAERPSSEFLRECVRYDNGRLFWLERPRSHFQTDAIWKTWNTAHAGTEAGAKNKVKNKYRWKVVITPYEMRRYQIIWAMHYGEWPSQVDHINRDSLDDRIENLRLATTRQNTANTEKHCDNTSGYKGVYWKTERKMWFSAIRRGGKTRFLGHFDTAYEAHLAYCHAAEQEYGEFHFVGSLPSYATHHELACSGSNDAGQEGSRFQ